MCICIFASVLASARLLVWSLDRGFFEKLFVEIVAIQNPELDCQEKDLESSFWSEHTKHYIGAYAGRSLQGN